IFSGSIAPTLARYRLDPDHRDPALVSPFERYRFVHPATRWFNLNDLAGAAKFFASNAGRILDFFAVKIARNLAEGKRTLLVSKKKFVGLCQGLLREKLEWLGAGRVKIVTGNWGQPALDDPHVIPLITYGVAGINLFEDFDAAYCLNSYNVAEV